MNTDLITIGTQEIDIVSVFSTDGIEAVVQKIEAEVRSRILDPASEPGRKEIKSLAHKVAQTKVAIDDAGKTLVAQWKSQSKRVDDARKIARDRLDALKEEIRTPVTEWEQAEEARVAAAKLALEISDCYTAAIEEDELWTLRREKAKREAEAAAAEQARLATLEEARRERERIEREERIREEAAARATKEAEDKAALEIANSARREAEARAAQERAERERIEAAERAEREKQAAIEGERRRAQEEAAQKERERLEAERQEAARLESIHQEEERASNLKSHRNKLNVEALKSAVDAGVSEAMAKLFIRLVIDGKIAHISIKY